MSDALKYLMQIRPEAMESYFSFIKQSGRHLDDKTRAIISVITKVDKQTETGFRQYLNRALQLGVAPNELIDALFTAFPTLGLAKIVWAADILLDMDIPAFRPEYLLAKPGWHLLVEESEIKINTVIRKSCDGRDLFIFHDSHNINVYDSRCPHQATDIPELALQDCLLTCPKHNWKFDVRTGECIERGNRPLQQYKNKLEKGKLMAFW